MLKVVFDTNVIVSAALYEESLPALLLSLVIINVKRTPLMPALDNP
jgi:predicted nucleic acid-binding protein